MANRNNGSFRKNKVKVVERNKIKNHGTCVCEYCGKRDLEPAGASGKVTHKTLTVDHFIPLDKGGSNGQANLYVTCWSCNVIKANLHPATISGSSDLLEFKRVWTSWLQGRENKRSVHRDCEFV